jgi:peptide/nickel transport system permease protein
MVITQIVSSLTTDALPKRHRGHRVLRRFARHRLALVGLVMIILLTGGAAFAPWIAPYDPDQIDLTHRFAPALSEGHVLGSDELGRDVLTRLLYAGRISLSVGVSAMVVTLAIGFTAGAFAAYCGGAVDAALMRLTDMALCFPNIFLLLFVAAFVTPTLSTVALIIGLTSWMEIARIVHAQILGLKEQDFIKAAQLSGASSIRIVLRQILPNAVAPLMVAATLNTANAILLESYISFLGYGIQPPAASWGNMLTNAQDDFQLDAWLAVFPGLAIMLAVLSFNFIGDGLRDALDVRIRL